jgi:hypothetical protein
MELHLADNLFVKGNVETIIFTKVGTASVLNIIVIGGVDAVVPSDTHIFKNGIMQSAGVDYKLTRLGVSINTSAPADITQLRVYLR